MEYIFGRNSYTGVETLRTKGDAHTNLEGFQETLREYDDADITDSFLVVCKTRSTEDLHGNCYDWYVIDKHNQRIQKTKILEARTEEVYDSTMDTQEALLETWMSTMDTQEALMEVAMLCYDQQEQIAALEQQITTLTGGNEDG